MEVSLTERIRRRLICDTTCREHRKIEFWEPQTCSWSQSPKQTVLKPDLRKPVTNLPHSADQAGLGNRNHVDFASGLVRTKGHGFYIPMQTVRKITAGQTVTDIEPQGQRNKMKLKGLFSGNSEDQIPFDKVAATLWLIAALEDCSPVLEEVSCREEGSRLLYKIKIKC